MSRRRRAIATILAVLLAWVTAVGTVRVAHPTQSRLLSADGRGDAQTSIAVPRSTLPSFRAPARSVVVPQPELAFLPAPRVQWAMVASSSEIGIAPICARDSHGSASTYDATAPPRLI